MLLIFLNASKFTLGDWLLVMTPRPSSITKSGGLLAHTSDVVWMAPSAYAQARVLYLQELKPKVLCDFRCRKGCITFIPAIPAVSEILTSAVFSFAIVTTQKILACVATSATWFLSPTHRHRWCEENKHRFIGWVHKLLCHVCELYSFAHYILHKFLRKWIMGSRKRRVEKFLFILE